VPCAGYESYAEDSAEPLPRAWPTTLKRQRRGLALVHHGLFDLGAHRAAPLVRAPQPTAPRRLP
jgi:hypothetical protein